MIKKTYALLMFIVVAGGLLAQKTYTISGYVEDASSGEKLISANVYDNKSGLGTVTNVYGFFSLTLPKDSVDLSFSYIGFQTVRKKIYLNKDMEMTIALPAALELTEVEVIADRVERIEEATQMSRVEVPVEQIKKIPALLGEVDVLKALQLLPGVQSGGEGQNGLYVRGGSPDQNLILLDGVPVYNVSHLLGIFSVFNADAIKNVTLTKGGFPARYGGRLSSVLEINMKEGNLNEFHGEGSIGLISSKIALQGPIVKGKTSFLLSARRTYADLIFKPIIKASMASNPEEKLDVKLFFYDLNAKVQHKFNNKHRLFASFYRGADVFEESYTYFGSSDTGGIKWGNSIAALRWNYQISNKLFANTTLTYSRYLINFIVGENYDNGDGTRDIFSAKYKSGIEDYAAKVDFDYIPSPQHYIRFGAAATRHQYSPGALALKSEYNETKFDTLLGANDAYSKEFNLYLEDDIQFGAFKTNVGLHASAFNVDGKTYASLQPRIGMRYLLSNDVALKASYSSMAQYINLLTFEGLSLPTDLWVPSTEKIKPQKSWQAAVGVAKTFLDKYEISIEGFYKEMKNVVSYKAGASFLDGLDNDWEGKITQGEGKAYGAEFFIQKKKGKTTGWIGYTLSWNNRRYDEFNGGEWYPYRYDRRHDISVVVSHKLTDNIDLSAAWVYGTGNAVSLNTYKYSTIENFQTGNYNPYPSTIESGGKKNAFRMSNYHRLDVSIEFHKKKKRWERTWTVGAYNAYYHKNPYFITAGTENNPVSPDFGKPVFKEISILPVIPSVSYSFKF